MPSLYLSGYQTEVHVKSQRLEVTRHGEDDEPDRTMNVPLFDVSRAVFAGRVNAHLTVVRKLLSNSIPVTLVSGSGRLLGTVQPPHNGSALLRLRQYELANDGTFALAVAEILVHCKIRNSLRVLQRLSANRKEKTEQTQEACEKIKKLFEKTASVSTLDELRGLEGMATAVYFKALGQFFPEDVPFQHRSRRPPCDAANALLSWTYTIVVSEVITAVCGAGLDPCLGYLHGISYGRPSLALDILEPYRAPLCDLLVLHILNHRILKAGDFEHSDEDGGVLLKRERHNIFFIQYEQVMERLFSRTKGGAHTTFRRCIRDDVYSLIGAMQKGENMEPFLMP